MKLALLEATAIPSGYNDVMGEIVTTTSSEIILGLIICVIAGCLIGIPLYKLSIKKSRIATEANYKEKELLASVVQGNTEVLQSLKVSIELNNNATTNILNKIQANGNETLSITKEMKHRQDDLIAAVDKAISLTQDINYVAKETRKESETIKDKLENINHDHVNIITQLSQKQE